MSGKSFFGSTPTDTRVEVPSSPITDSYNQSHSDSDRSPFLPSDGNPNGNGLQPGERSREDARLGSKSTSQDSTSGSLEGIKALPPILSYCAASITMTVVNKFVLSGSHFSLNLLVLLIQCLVGVILVKLGQKLGLLSLRDWNTKDAKAWLPISTLLVLVIWTGSKALQFLKIPVYTIFKNLTIILIAYGEVLWFGGRVTPLTLLSFLLMVLSSLIAAYSDISRSVEISNVSLPHSPDDPITGKHQSNLIPGFNTLKTEKDNLMAMAGNLNMDMGSLLASGYLWMGLNCICSAAYVLAMRKRIKVTGFKDWDTMYFNNLLSVPVLIIMSLLVEDWSQANFDVNFPAETRTRLIAAIVFSGACAIFIAYTTAWCVRTTSSTTYSMVGALNKLPLALSGMVFFGDAVTPGSTSAIGTGFLAGLVYAFAKNKQAAASKAASLTASGSLSGNSTSALGSSGPGVGGVEGERPTHSNGNIIPMHNLNGDKELRKD